MEEPKWHLIFLQNPQKEFFFDGRIKTSEADDPLEWKNLGGSSTHFRALCILLLLAKYRLEQRKVGDFRVRRKRVRKNEKAERSNWIHSLDCFLAKPKNKEKLIEFFNVGVIPFTAKRGSGKLSDEKPNQGKSHADYFNKSFSMANVEFYIKTARRPKKLTGLGLVNFAKKLEYFPVEVTGEWEAIVPQLKKDMDANEKQSEISGLLTKPLSSKWPQNVAIFSPWRNFIHRMGNVGDAIKNRLESPQKGECWFVVTMSPVGFEPWTQIFCDAVAEHGVDLKWICHCETMAKKSGAIRAQWEMNFPGDGPARERHRKALADMKDYKTKLNSQMLDAVKTRKKAKMNSGSFKFFKSIVPHPFMAFLALPNKKQRYDAQTAPAETLCLIQPYAMFPLKSGKRFGMLLAAGSEALNIYYRSIMEFFNKENKYLRLEQ